MHRERIIDEHDEYVARVFDRPGGDERPGVELLVALTSHYPRPRLLRRGTKLLALALTSESPEVASAAVIVGMLEIQ